MNPDFVKFLRCPKTKNKLYLQSKEVDNGRVKTGTLIEEHSRKEYPITNFIPRFVTQNSYVDNFGLQWNVFYNTQYDSISKHSVSKKRLREETKWSEDLRNEVILEIGCGSGRFTEHAAESGSILVSFDYSNAVEANYKSNGHKVNVLIVQADLFHMPFQENFFDKAFCLGVLQATPDPERAFLTIINYLKPGGKIASDIYVKNLTRWFLQTKYYIRPWTKNINPNKLLRMIVRYIDFMWPLARIIRKIPKIGYAINWKLVIADYSKVLPLADDKTLKQWAYLDTMDMLSPAYDYPQTLSTFRKWHEKAKLINIDVHYGYNGIEGRGTKLLQ